MEPESQRLYTTAVYCRQNKKPYNNKNSRKLLRREGTEAWKDGRGGERVRAGGRAGRRLVTGVRSGWGRASRSMRTKYHICQQFVVEFGRTCVREHQRHLDEASRDMLELASQALSTSNDVIFNLLSISLSKLRTLQPAFSRMQVTRPLWGSSSAHDVQNTTTLTRNMKTV